MPHLYGKCGIYFLSAWQNLDDSLQQQVFDRIIVNSGVTQGSILGPLPTSMFLIFLVKCPLPFPSILIIQSSVDQFVLFRIKLVTKPISRQLQPGEISTPTSHCGHAHHQLPSSHFCQLSHVWCPFLKPPLSINILGLRCPPILNGTPC